MIYLDYAATSPVRPEVVELIEKALRNTFGNPSSTYQIGKKAKHELVLARKQFSEQLNVPETNLYFTSGATEANNWAIRSQAYKARELGYGHHIVSSAIEHPSVMEVLKYLETDGFEVTYVKPNKSGEYTVDAFIAASTDYTMGWVAMAVNNEVGSLLPIPALGKEAKEKGYWFHVDTVQAIGQIDWDFGSLPVTSFVGSGHKFYAPKGIGFLVYQPFDKAMILNPLLFGGGQERKKRSGTENIPYILGMTRAFELMKEEASDRIQHFNHLQSHLYKQLNEANIDFEINGDPNKRVSYIHSLWVKGLPASQLLIRMDMRDIYISAGSACSAGSIQPSAILTAYYPEEPARWQESIRISFGYNTTKEDIDEFVTVLKQSVEGKQ